LSDESWAEIVGLAEDANVLESIEAEEANADELLSEIAERVNYQAAAQSERRLPFSS
jgi:ferritin-like metal-binding protein YciE